MRGAGDLDAQEHGFHNHCAIVVTGKFWFKVLAGYGKQREAGARTALYY